MNTAQTQPDRQLQSQPARAVAKTTVRDRLNSPAFREAVASVLPRHLTPDRFLRIALLATTKQPKLLECTQASLFNALLSLSQFGLEPDGRRAHLIPYGQECQLIIDYKGLAELAMRSGLVSCLHADVVCHEDEFEYDCGELKKHTINFKKPRGQVYAAYALVRYKDGAAKADVMTVDEIEAIRKRSRAGRNGPWVTDWNEMAKKTVFRRLSKMLPLSPEFRDAVDADDDDLPAKTARAESSLVTVVQPFEVPESPAMDEQAEAAAGLAPEPPRDADDKPPVNTAQAQLQATVGAAGFDLPTFLKTMAETGSLKDADSFPDWDSIPNADAVRLVRVMTGKSKLVMIEAMAKMKGALL